jgi:hypothetical protein
VERAFAAGGVGDRQPEQKRDKQQADRFLAHGE